VEESAIDQKIAGNGAWKIHLQESAGIILLICGILLTLATFSYDPLSEEPFNFIGRFGSVSAASLHYLFGKGSLIVGPYLVLLGIYGLTKGLKDPFARLLALLILLFSATILLYFFDDELAGGILGKYMGRAFFYVFGQTGSIVIVSGTLLGALLLSGQTTFNEYVDGLFRIVRKLYLRLHGPAGEAAIMENRTSSDDTENNTTAIPNRSEKSMNPDITMKYAENLPLFERVEESIPSPPPPPSNERYEQVEESFHYDGSDHEGERHPDFRQEEPPRSGQINENLRNLYTRLQTKGRPSVPERKEAAEESVLFRGFFSGNRFVFQNGAERPWQREVVEEPSAFPSEEMHREEVDEGFGSYPSVYDDETIDGYEAFLRSNAENEFYDDEYEMDEEHFESQIDDEISDELIEEEMASFFPADREKNGALHPAQPDRDPSVAPSLHYELPSVRMNGKYFIPTEILEVTPRSLPEDLNREIHEVKENLERVMSDYGIQAKVVHWQRGPIITMYEIKLEPGVKVARLLGIYDELKMNLEAASLRIIAPIPGKSAIGIEIPNRKPETVRIGDLIRHDAAFFTAHRELPLILGKDIAGENVYTDLVRLPHLLIAGATGAGKSVYMNVLISSLLYTRSPQEVRFIMIDPKMVELKLFEGIPHLLMPVITDVRKAGKALSWAIEEMERRYSILSALKSRDIRSYNERMKKAKQQTMPYIVIMIDELSDLMMVSGKEVEDSIIRLTQKARAVGIHIIMATQRPSVDVITALIKANCPARISFQVAQKTDARTILDSNGSEALMGRGDMLYKSPGASGLRRLQAPLVTEEEIETIVYETGRYGSPVYVDLPEDSQEGEGGINGADDIDSALVQEAWRVILESGKTSTSYVQRRLRIGYNRAATIIEILEENGYLGAATGNKPREILKRS